MKLAEILRPTSRTKPYKEVNLMMLHIKLTCVEKVTDRSFSEDRYVF